MVSIYMTDNEYDEFWDDSNGFPNTNEQTNTQHFPVENVSTSETEPYAIYTAQPNINYHCGGYKLAEISKQNLLEALQTQTAQLSISMNQLPVELCTPYATMPQSRMSETSHIAKALLSADNDDTMTTIPDDGDGAGSINNGIFMTSIR
jgi:hypothetical protein